MSNLRNPANCFHGNFLPNSLQKLSYFRCKLFFNKNIFQGICLNNKALIIFFYQSIFFLKNFNLNDTHRKKLQLQLNTRIYKNKILAASNYCLHNYLKFYNFIELELKRYRNKMIEL